MRVVLQYHMEPIQGESGRIVTLRLPVDAVPLYVAFHGEDLCLWALADPEAEWKDFKLAIYETGQEVDDSAAYVGSARIDAGFHSYVFHVFSLPGQ